MQSNTTLDVSLSRRAGEGDYIMIEQEKWGVDVGRTSISQGIINVGSMLFGGGITSPNCGGLAGFDTDVYVYPSRKDLRFKFKAFPALVIKSAVNFVIREEIVQCSLRREVSVSYPVLSMMQEEWLGPCFDEAGNVVGRPELSRDGRVYSLSQPVYGSIKVRYVVFREEYLLKVEERNDSIENNFQCVAYCVWEKGVEFLEVEAPSGYDGSAGNCGNGLYGGKVCQPEDSGSYPSAVRADRLVRVDYCSQEIISDVTTQAVENDLDKEPCSDGTITTN